MSKEVLELFNCMVVDDTSNRSINYNSITDGFITDFTVSFAQSVILKNHFKPLPLRTLFSVKEVNDGKVFDLLVKQFLHYVDSFLLDSSGVFDLEVEDGKVITLNFVKGITVSELSDMVNKILQANSPFKNTEALRLIIRDYNISVDYNKIKNNEMKMIFYNHKIHKMTNGDDIVRYFVYKATDSSLLIKSPEVLSKLSVYKNELIDYHLETYSELLAQVYNRHKAIILSLKKYNNRNLINRIARLSKTLHVPMKESANKTFMNDTLNRPLNLWLMSQKLDSFGLRDKFKFLNLIEYKLLQRKDDVYIVRNGKAHYKNDTKVYSVENLKLLKHNVLKSIKKNLSHLEGKTILLDNNIHYGLPVSRKQTLGNLPYGTIVKTGGRKISSGIYWENSWNCRDLDLSAIDEDGFRVGWGSMDGYNNENVKFSGDITNAPSGAMEFLTTPVTYKKPYGLFLNVFNGNTPCSAEIVVGNQIKNTWIDNPVLREKITLESPETIIGFVKNGEFKVYSPRVSSNRTSQGKNSVLVAKALADNITINSLFDELGINYTVNPLDIDGEIDYNLSYQQFSYDKLENLLQL